MLHMINKNNNTNNDFNYFYSIQLQGYFVMHFCCVG